MLSHLLAAFWALHPPRLLLTPLSVCKSGVGAPRCPAVLPAALCVEGAEPVPINLPFC